MKYRIEFEQRALDDIRKIIKSSRKADSRKIEIMLEELKVTPQIGTGKPEPLKHNLSGFWSRRVNKKDRLIYQIIEEPNAVVVIVSALGHY